MSPVQPGDVGIDYSGYRPPPASVVSDGGRFILRYSAGVGNDAPNAKWKLCGSSEIADATAAGLDFIANSEWYESRITEGAAAGTADGTADLAFWKSRGLARGASIYASWDQNPARLKWRKAAAYLRAYDKALGGYYHVDCYAGTKFLSYALGKKIIRYGWRPNAGSWSGDGLPYQPKLGPAILDTARQATPAHIWQTGSYWYGKQADENVILRTPVGSHLEALNPIPESKPPTPAPVPGLENDDMPLIVYVDRADCVKQNVRWPGIFLLAGSTLAHVATTADVTSLKKAGVKQAVVSLTTYRNLGGK